MDLRTIRHQVADILRDVRISRHDTSPAARSIAGLAAVDRLNSLLASIDHSIDAVPTGQPCPPSPPASAVDPRDACARCSRLFHHLDKALHSASPADRAEAGARAMDDLRDMWDGFHRAMDDLAASSAAAAAARTACREHLYPRPAPPCIHEDDGQEEAGMGEPDSVPAPWKSPD